MMVSTHRARCGKCGAEFSYPWLGDFSYGSFLFAGEKGGVFGYFCGLSSPVWEFISTVLVKQGQRTRTVLKRGEQAVRIQAACAEFADTINGQRLCFHEVCPMCQFGKLDLWPAESTGTIAVGDVTHATFMSMPEDIREERLLAFDRNFPSLEYL
jgi:hypothetical protein